MMKVIIFPYLPDVDDIDSDDETVFEEMSCSDSSELDVVNNPNGREPLYAVDCNPQDATLVASGGGDNLVWLWRIGREDKANELKGHTDSISCLYFSKDGQLLASGGLDACVKIWDNSGNLKCTFDGPDEGHEFEWLSWHPSAHLIMAGCTDKNVWLWNADKGALLNVFCGHGDSVTCGGFTPDGKSICTGSLDATLRIWNPRSGRGYTKASALTCLTYTSDSVLALTGSENGFLSVVNITSGKVVIISSKNLGYWLILIPLKCNSMYWGFNEMYVNYSMPWVATGGADNKLVIWDLQHSACRSSFEYQDDVSCLLWLGESRYVASACGNGQIIISDTRSGENVRIFKDHSKRIQQLVISADNKFLVSASEDGTSRLFDISDFK
ncbi:Angio-associated migratory cell protein [Bienertia sinuspersici]